MELLILAGVGLAGYKISNTHRRPVVTSQPYVGDTDFKDVCAPDDADRNNATAASNRLFNANDFAASRNPCKTGVIAPNQRELFYRSDKTQATSAAYKQDRMELFTGQLDRCRSKTGTFAPKTEQGPMFDPALNRMPVTFSGRQAYVDVRGAQDEERYQVGMKHHGAGPVDPIRVGPGLGIGPDVPAAGGFHQFYQVLPENVNVHRKNNLPGRINPGSAPVQQGANMGIQHTNTDVDKPVWGLDRMPLVPGKCAVTAPACNGQPNQNKRQDGSRGFMGHAFGGLVAPAAHTTAQQVRNGRQEDCMTNHTMNAFGAGSQTGGYGTQHFQDPGLFKHHLPPLPTGAVGGTNTAGFLTNNHQQPPTQREQSGFFTNIAAAFGAPAKRDANATRTKTGRETLQTQPLVGIAGGPSAHGVYMTNDTVRAKPETCVGYMPNGSTQNMYNPNITSARLKSPANAAHVNVGGMQTVNYGKPGSDLRCYNKLPIENPHLDLNLAKDVLSTNGLTHPLPFRST